MYCPDPCFTHTRLTWSGPLAADKNNVFSMEPRVYVEGDEDADAGPAAGGVTAGNAATAAVGLVGVAVLSVGGTAFFLFYENFVGLGIFWAVLFGVVAYYAYSTVFSKED